MQFIKIATSSSDISTGIKEPVPAWRQRSTLAGLAPAGFSENNKKVFCKC